MLKPIPFRSTGAFLVLLSIFFTGISLDSASAQAGPVISPENMGGVCSEGEKSENVECNDEQPDLDIQTYWRRHCQNSIGRYVEFEDAPEVIFIDKLYFVKSGSAVLTTPSNEYTFELPELTADETFVVTEVWCARSQLRTLSTEFTEYVLGDLEIYVSPQANIPAGVTISRNDPTDTLLEAHQYRMLLSELQLDRKINSEEIDIAPKQTFIESSERVVEIEVEEFFHQFPELHTPQAFNSQNLSDLPTQGKRLCEEETTTLQCAIVECVSEEENFFNLQYPYHSEYFTSLTPIAYPSWDNLIVGLPVWIEISVAGGIFNNVPAHILEAVEKNQIDTDGTTKTLGEHFSGWVGDIETCLEEDQGIDNPRAGYWTAWESQNPNSANNCVTSIAVSDTLTPECEVDSFSCFDLERIETVAERNRPFTAVFLSCGRGTLYDMGEAGDNSDKLWCGIDKETIPGNLSLAIPVPNRPLTEIYTQYIEDCSYTYSRSSLDEPEGKFIITATRWRSVTCWMHNRETCGTWWFRWDAQFDAVVGEAQALEDPR